MYTISPVIFSPSFPSISHFVGFRQLSSIYFNHSKLDYESPGAEFFGYPEALFWLVVDMGDQALGYPTGFLKLDACPLAPLPIAYSLDHEPCPSIY